MKRLFTLLYIILAVLTARGQMYGYKTNFTVSERDFCDTIPIEFENNQVYIRAQMNGKPFRFNLDTGSSQGMVYSGAGIGYWRELGNIVSRDANHRLDTVKVIALPEFSLGRLTINGYVATVMPRSAVKHDFDAILGFDLFNKGLSAKIDTRQKIMIITDRKHVFDEEPGHEVRYRMKWFVPYLMVSPFRTHTDEVLFDLGSRQLYTMSRQSFETATEGLQVKGSDATDSRVGSYEQFPLGAVGLEVEDIAYGHLAIGSFGAERPDEVAFLHLERLKIGDFALRDVRVVTTEGASRLGASILNYGSIIINPRRRRIIFQPYSDADTAYVGNKHPAVAFVPKDGRAAVGLIYKNSQPYRAGLRQGDIIMSIDGTPIPTFSDFVNHHFLEAEYNVFTVIDEEGKTKTLNIER